MNKLLRFVLSSFSFINIVLSNNCFTPIDVQNKGLVSYQNKVYDITNYIHPAGQDTLLLAKGKSLEEFFNIPEYSFHIRSRVVKNDLNSIYIGDLYQSCGVNNTQNYTDNYTDNYKEKKENYILNNPSLYFPIISTSFFIFIVISTIIINNTNLYLFFGRIINLYCCYSTIGEITFLFCYTLWWITLFLLSLASEYLFTALGLWICLNLAFTILPMTRNSIWIKFLNCPYNSLMFIHKFIAILTTLSVIIKIILIIVVYNFNFLFGRFNSLMGTISSLSILLTVILAMPIIRKNIFELFYYSHRILCIVTIITMSLHYISCLYYILPSFFLYIIDMILRIIYIKKSIYTKVQAYKLAYNTTYSIITLKLEKKININPGSYFFICCKNISKTEWHPISLMNIKNKGLNFCIKDMGKNSWSNKLINYDKNYEDLDILLQGPYMHFKLNYNYKYLLCISTGVGITPFFSILDDIKKNTPKILDKIIFIWIIPHESFIKPFLNIFDSIDTDLVIVNIYVTKSNNNRILDDKYYSLLNIYNEKPNIEICVDNFIIDNSIKDTKEIGIFSCGSSSLTKDLLKTCNKLNIDLYNENFT